MTKKPTVRYYIEVNYGFGNWVRFDQEYVSVAKLKPQLKKKRANNPPRWRYRAVKVTTEVLDA